MIPFKQHDGPLTSELLREPGRFGLGQLPAGAVPDAVTTSICGYCSTGCRLRLHLKNGEAIGLTPEARYPVNLGMACPKGWEALTVLDSPDRASVPLLRDHPHGELRESDWDEAIGTMVGRFKDIQARHGKESLAFISTGQIPCEEMAFLGALAKFGMGMKHGDGNTRQCMATAVAAYKQSFGFDAPPYTYADFEESDVMVFVGGNPAIAHPILWQRVLSNRRSPEIVVIDPRRTETAHSATRHIALKPKGDLWLFYALAHCIIDEGRLDQEFLDAHTEGFREFKAFLTEYTPEKAEAHTGLPPQAIREFARVISDPTKRVSWWWTMGVNQSYEGTRTAQAMINLALMTGNIGKPGTGANSITGQCNAMGSRLFSNTTNLLGGHDFANPAHRQKIADLLGIEESRIQRENGWAYDQIIDGIESGAIKGLWVIATNPNHSWIDRDRFRRLRDKLDFLVVQDMYSTTETALIADLVLPAAAWGEKEGVFINSERRIGTIRQVRKPPGVALSDFRIFRLLANAWCGDLFTEWTTPEAVFQLLTKITAGQPCDISGISGYEMIDTAGGIQWPYPAENSDTGQERRLFADGRFFTANRRAKFLYDAPRETMPEEPDGKYPFILITGRGSSSQWHTQTRTAKSSILRKLSPSELYLDVHPSDAARFGISERDEVEVMSRRGSLVARAWLTPTMQRGQVFLPMHDPEVNRLTHASFDPHSRQPSYKASAVAIRKLKNRA